jgi:hypothetical protein
MDGFQDSIFMAKSECKSQFETGISLYRKREFAEAKSIFKDCLEKCAQDLAAQVYITRCNQFLNGEQNEDWDGITRMTSK